MRILLASRLGKVIVGLSVLLFVLVAVGLVLLYQPRTADPQPPQLKAQVQQKIAEECSYRPGTCWKIQYLLLEGEDKNFIGEAVWDPVFSGEPPAVDDKLLLTRQGESSPRSVGLDEYPGLEKDRKGALLWLAIFFASLTVLIAGKAGLRSLVGLAGSITVVWWWLLPTLAQTDSPLLAAMVGGGAVILLQFGIVYGLKPTALVAMIATFIAFLTVILCGILWVEWASLSGQISESSQFLAQGNKQLSPSALLIAAAMLGALGVLDDVSVSQVATTDALHRAQPEWSQPKLWKEAMQVGRAHVAAATNSLLLTYTAAALPLLLLISNSGGRLGPTLNSELVAQDVVIGLVGSIGLAVVVPIGTIIALQVRLPADEIHAHSH
jgi:uncharacterized membrane protein